MNITFNRINLSNLEEKKKDKENIKYNAQILIDLVVEVCPLPWIKNMVTLFSNILKASYYKHMMGNLTQ